MIRLVGAMPGCTCVNCRPTLLRLCIQLSLYEVCLSIIVIVTVIVIGGINAIIVNIVFLQKPWIQLKLSGV